MPRKNKQALNGIQSNRPGRLVVGRGLSRDEVSQEWSRAFEEEFRNGRKKGTLYQYAFLAHYYSSEKRLEKLGLLKLFRKTQGLPDYARAEASVKRGWGCWMELEFGITEADAKDPLKIRQFLLLFQLRGAQSREQRQRILRAASIPCGASAARGEDEFFQRLGNVLDGSPRREDEAYDFAQLLLHNWLTRFWWLMPLKAVAQDMARMQGEPDDTEMVGRLYARLRQIKTRKVPGRKGRFFSAGWNGCFYSTKPPLIDCIENNASPLLNSSGRRLLV
jgi:hypothetical protein